MKGSTPGRLQAGPPAEAVRQGTLAKLALALLCLRTAMSLATTSPPRSSLPMLHGAMGSAFSHQAVPLQESIVLVRLLEFLLESEDAAAVLRRAATGLGLLPQVVWADVDGDMPGHLAVDVGAGEHRHRAVICLANPESGADRAAVSATLGLVAHVYRQKCELARLGAEAATDSLTGLWNRRGFDPLVDQALARSARTGEKIALLVIDVDHFKSINDKFGHAAGDRALVAVAEALRHELRPSDIIARLGGDELALLLAGADGQGAMQVCERVRRTLNRTNPLSPHPLTLSIGIADVSALHHLTGDNARADLFTAADKALYAAKAAGRDRAVCHPSVADGPSSSGESSPRLRLIRT